MVILGWLCNTVFLKPASGSLLLISLATWITSTLDDAQSDDPRNAEPHVNSFMIAAMPLGAWVRLGAGSAAGGGIYVLLVKRRLAAAASTIAQA